MAQTRIAKAAEDLIIQEEVSSEAVYRKKYEHAEWPGGASGVTIGIGYDVGAGVKDKAQLHADWGGLIPESMVTALEPCIGKTGMAGHSMLGSVYSVRVPWEAAIAVFEKKDIPRWDDICRRNLPNYDLLNPVCKGVLVSLAYNRGPSFNMSGDRYKEMRAIKAHMAAREWDKIPAQLRAMKRLWNNGLVGRREREAVMFEQGLKAKIVPPQPLNEPDKHVRPATDGPTLKPPSNDKPVLTGVAAVALAALQFIQEHPVAVGAFALVVAVAVGFFIHYQHKERPK